MPPSQIHAENLQDARGNFRIHDRDSGVARHPAFYKLVEAMATTTGRKMQDFLFEGTAAAAAENLNLASEDLALWQGLAKSIKSLNATHMGQSRTIHSGEVFFSEGIARCLNHFCRRQRLPFTFSHQYPCAFKAGSSEEDTVDIAAFWSSDKGDDRGVLDAKLLGMIEVKKGFHGGAAKWQLCGYISEASESQLIDADIIYRLA